MANNEDKKPIKNKEAPGFGYDKSIDDLKVIGKNRAAKKGKDRDWQFYSIDSSTILSISLEVEGMAFLYFIQNYPLDHCDFL